MTARSRGLLIAFAVLAIGAAAVWQWGSYGPFEVTVATPGRGLEQVTVEFVYVRPRGEGLTTSYRSVRVGRSNEPVRFPRGFVCFCLRAPSLTYFPVHPMFLGGWGSVPASIVRHLGVIHAPDHSVRTWSEVAAEYERVISPTPQDRARDADAKQRDRDQNIGSMFETFIRTLETAYVPFVQLSGSAITTYMGELRQQLGGLPLSSEYKERLQKRVDGVEAALRARESK